MRQRKQLLHYVSFILMINFSFTVVDINAFEQLGFPPDQVRIAIDDTKTEEEPIVSGISKKPKNTPNKRDISYLIVNLIIVTGIIMYTEQTHKRRKQEK